jgi:Uma2 family endonuclease
MSTVLDRPAAEAWADADDLRGEWDDVAPDEPPEEPLPVSALSLAVASDLSAELTLFARPTGVGKVYTEMVFRLPPPVDRERRPDVAFVPFTRWPREQPIPKGRAWQVVPDLCVEVVSPTDKAEEVREKVLQYFAVGVRLVWVIFPGLQVVDVFASPTAVRVLSRADRLDGGDVLPGFTLPLAELLPAAGQPGAA